MSLRQSSTVTLKKIEIPHWTLDTDPNYPRRHARKHFSRQLASEMIEISYDKKAPNNTIRLSRNSRIRCTACMLCDIYQPKKITQAMLNIVDTPGLSRSHDGNAGKLAAIREAGCLVMVVAAFSGAKAVEDLQSFEEDLLLADLDIVASGFFKVKGAYLVLSIATTCKNCVNFKMMLQYSIMLTRIK